jgi:hypothetical protein
VREPDDPPHAASSSTSDPSPVAAAHPLLRMTDLQFDKDGPAPEKSRRCSGAGRILKTVAGSAADDVVPGQLDHVPHAGDAVAGSA